MRLTNKVQEVAQEIGLYYLRKNNNDYAKTAEEVSRLLIDEILVVKDTVVIKTQRPGLLIGKRGENVDELEKALNLNIHIIETDENPLLQFLIPERYDDIEGSCYMEDLDIPDDYDYYK